MPTSTLGNLLKRQGLLSDNDYATIMNNRSYHSGQFAKGVIALGIVDDEDLAAFIADTTKIQRAPRNLLSSLDQDALGHFDPLLMSRLDAVPIQAKGEQLQVAVVDPFDKITIRQLEFFTGMRIVPMVASLSQIRTTLARLIKGYQPIYTPFEEFITTHATVTPGQDQRKSATAKANGDDMLGLDASRSDDNDFEDLNIEEEDLSVQIEASPSGADAQVEQKASELPGLDGDDTNLEDLGEPLSLEEPAATAAAEPPPSDTEGLPLDLEAPPAPELELALESQPEPAADETVPDDITLGADDVILETPSPAAEPTTEIVEETLEISPEEMLEALPEEITLEDTPAPKPMGLTVSGPQSTGHLNSAMLKITLAKGAEDTLKICFDAIKPLMHEAYLYAGAAAEQLKPLGGWNEASGGSFSNSAAPGAPFDQVSWVELVSAPDKNLEGSSETASAIALLAESKGQFLGITGFLDKTSDNSVTRQGISRLIKAAARQKF